MYASNGDTPEEEFELENYIEVKEYQIYKDYNNYNMLLGRKNDSVIIRSLQFFYEHNLKEFFLYKFNTTNELFKFYNDIFEQNGVTIKSIKNNQEMKLLLSYQGKQFDLILNYDKQNTGHIINYLWNKSFKLKKDLNIINDQNKQIKDENEILINKNKELNNEINKIKEDNKELNKEINQVKQELNNYKLENNQIKQNSIMIMDNFNKIMEEINTIKSGMISNNNNIYQNNNPIFNLNNYNNQINNFNNDNFNNDNFNNDNSNNYNNNNFYVLIREPGRIGIITIDNCSPTDKVKDLMEKYKIKINDNNLNFYFLYNAKRLEETSTLAESKISNNATLEVVKRRGF